VRLQEDNPQDGIVIAKVDATKETELANRFYIQSFPRLKYFADRKMYTYSGARNIDAMYDFVTGGYKSASADDSIPPPPSMFLVKMKEFRQKFEAFTQESPHYTYLLEDFDHIITLRKNAAIVLLVMGAFVGLAFGIILSLLMGMGSTKTKAQKKKKKD